jgi:uncharacterized protein (DUF1330 family)
MKRHITLFLTLVSGIGIGAAAVQGLHAQAKPKAYRVVEAEVLDAGAVATYNTLIQAAIKAAGGRNFNTAGGKIIAFAGEPPKRVAITEWDSLEQVESFVNSAAYKSLAPERDKAAKIREYAVEATQ